MKLVNKIISQFENSDQKSKKLMQNISFSVIIKGISLIVSLFNMPAYINYFSNQIVLGFWFTAISMLSWILTFDLGIGNGLRNHLVEPILNRDYKTIKTYISSAYFSVGTLVLFLSVVCLVITPFLNWNSIFNISSEIVEKETLLFMVTVLIIGILIQFWLKLVISVLYALQKSALVGLLSVLSTVLMLLYTLYGRTGDLTYDLKSISVAYVIASNLPYLVATLLIFSFSMKKSRPNLSNFKFKHAKNIVKLGGIFFYLQILTMLMFGTNEFLISYLVSPEEVVTFQVYNRIFSLISTLFNLSLTPVWSAVTEARVTKDFKWISNLYQKLNRMLIILIPIQIMVVLFMPFIIKIWLGQEDFFVNYTLGIIFALYNILFMKVSIDTSIIAGIGNLKIQSISLTITVLIKIVLSVVLTYYNHSLTSIILANVIALIPYVIIEYYDIKHNLKFTRRG